jgi:hypothetical protein
MRGILIGGVLAGACLAAAPGAAQIHRPVPDPGSAAVQCAPSIAADIAQFPLLSPEQAQADLAKIVDELKTAHSGNEDYLTAEEFDEQVELARARLSKPLNAYQISLAIMQLLNSTHDGHASLIEPRPMRLLTNSSRPFLFPFNVRILDRRIYATADLTPGRQVPPGSEILSIDGRPSDQILDTLAAFYTTDGFGQAGLYRSFEYEGWRPFRRSFAYIKGFPDRYTIGYRNYRTGQVGSISVCAVTSADARERMTQQPDFAPKRNSDMPPKTPLVDFSVRDGVGVLRIARLVENSYAEPDSLFEGYYRDVFRKVRDQGVKSLIIDLRNNGGGMGSNGALLLPYLVSKPVTPAEGAWGKLASLENYPQSNENYEKNIAPDGTGKYRLTSTDWLRELRTYEPSRDLAYRGRLYVLIDGGTISAAAQLAGFLRGFTNATFVGEETSGAAGISNGVIVLAVGGEHSNVGVNIPAVHTDSNIAKELRKRPVTPDIKAAPTIAGILAGEDEVLATALGIAADAPRRACGAVK